MADLPSEPTHVHGGLSPTAVARAEWAEEFIYGAMTVVIVIAGLEVDGGHPTARPDPSGGGDLVGAGATWAAHAFSAVIGARLGGKRTTAKDGLLAMRHAWPIIVAALPAAGAMILASAGLWPLRFAIELSYLISIGILGAAGVAAGRATDLSVARSIGWGVATASLGGVIVLVEVALHH